LFDALKADPEIAQIPVYFISIHDDSMEVLEQGAIGFLTKPVTKSQLHEALQKISRLSFAQTGDILLVEDDDVVREVLVAMLREEGFKVIAVNNAEDGIEKIKAHKIHSMIVDLRLPGMSGLEMLEAIADMPDIQQPPVMMYTARDITDDERQRLQKYTDVFIRKNGGTTDFMLKQVMEAVGDATNHLPTPQVYPVAQSHVVEVVSEVAENVAMPPVAQQSMFAAPELKMEEVQNILQGKTVLLVDDDTRNIFALSKVLKKQMNMKVFIADNGQKALDLLNVEAGIDIVLMDIMMPVMNGYEAIERIRMNPGFASLPVIAVTAKAMSEDAQKCLDAGANAYVSKPIDALKLFEEMGRWLQKR
jgi:CheY-like chemotaxis protein